MLSLVEREKCLIASGPGLVLFSLSNSNSGR